jgi:quinol monooxygenase YgiN
MRPALLTITIAFLAFTGFFMQTNSAQEKSNSQQERLLRHVVLFQFKEEATEEQINEIVEAFGKLPSRIDAIHDYEWGTDVSPEGLSKGFTHCFLVTFKSEQARDEYLPHPAHQAFVEKLKPILKDVTVVDYWTRPGT